MTTPPYPEGPWDPWEKCLSQWMLFVFRSPADETMGWRKSLSVRDSLWIFKHETYLDMCKGTRSSARDDILQIVFFNKSCCWQSFILSFGENRLVHNMALIKKKHHIFSPWHRCQKLHPFLSLHVSWPGTKEEKMKKRGTEGLEKKERRRNSVLPRKIMAENRKSFPVISFF